MRAAADLHPPRMHACRCTKNFFMYLHPGSGQWQRFPWDLDAALGQDNGLGGLPGSLWCILACEQWHSPLYCDSEHPQDLAQKTAWGEVTVVGTNTYSGACPAAAAVCAPCLPCLLGQADGPLAELRSLLRHALVRASSSSAATIALLPRPLHCRSCCEEPRWQAAAAADPHHAPVPQGHLLATARGLGRTGQAAHRRRQPHRRARHVQPPDRRAAGRGGHAADVPAPPAHAGGPVLHRRPPAADRLGAVRQHQGCGRQGARAARASC